MCHSLKGVGGKLVEKGGPLDGIGSKRDAAWLRAYFADPKSKIPDAKMPKLKLSPAEWDALVEYMLTPQVVPISSVDWTRRLLGLPPAGKSHPCRTVSRWHAVCSWIGAPHGH